MFLEAKSCGNRKVVQSFRHGGIRNLIYAQNGDAWSQRHGFDDQALKGTLEHSDNDLQI